MKNFKKVRFIPAVATLGCAGIFFAACGDDSSSNGDFALDNAFEIVLAKTNYDYKSKDSLFVLKKPECKENTIGGYLVWNKESDDKDTVEVSKKGSTVRLRESGAQGWKEYKYDGKSFPQGVLYEGNVSKEPLRYATRIDGSQIKEVFQYDGSCLMKSYNGVMFDENVAMESADNALSRFYKKFSEGTVTEKQIVNDLRAPSCDELTIFNGDVTIKVDYLRESSGQITLKYSKSDDCPISFKIRYANEESDCSDAYDDFEKEKSKDEKFDFSNYSLSVDYSTYCVERLVLEFKREKGILTKSAVTDDEVSSSAVARAAVDVVGKGLKK